MDRNWALSFGIFRGSSLHSKPSIGSIWNTPHSTLYTAPVYGIPSMSQSGNQDSEMGDVMSMNSYFQQSFEEESHFDDNSRTLFTMYSKLAEEEDNKMVQRWQKDAQGIIIFTGLFSAVVAALVVVSVQDLRPNSQDISAFYLEKMYQLQADPNASRPSVPPALAQPPIFSPPRYAIWVNSLWFLSLVISLTCAMLATLLQQWARRYISSAQVPRCSPKKRAQMRAYFSHGVEKFHVDWAVEALPTLVHLSLFIFFFGLLIFLFNIDHTVFNTVVCWVAFSSAAYVCVTFMPIFWHDSPYYAPLSSTFYFLYTFILYALFQFLAFIASLNESSPKFNFWTWSRFNDSRERYHDLILGGLWKAAEEAASKQSFAIDGRVFEWTVDALNEDDELERFLEVIPGSCHPNVIPDFPYWLPREIQQKIEAAAGEFLCRTLLSHTVPESVAIRRLTTCLNAALVVGGFSGVVGVLQNLEELHWRGVPQSIEIGHFLLHWIRRKYTRSIPEVSSIVASIIATVRERDDRWMALTLDHLGVPEDVLEYYLANGDSLLLANLIHVTRQFIHHPWLPFTTLEFLCIFNVHNTLPGLQHDFCALWNEVVQEARGKDTGSPLGILLVTRRVYMALHRGTDAAPTAFSSSTPLLSNVMWQVSSYPLCNIPGHHSDPISHVHNLEIGESFHAPVITPPGDLCHDRVPATVTTSPPTRSDNTTPLVPTSHQDPHMADEPISSDVLSTTTASSHHAHLVPTANIITSPELGVAIATRDSGNHPTFLSIPASDLPSTPVAPPFTPQSDSACLLGSAVSAQQNVDDHDVPPSTLSASTPSLPLPLPGPTPLTDLQSFTPTSTSQAASNQTSPSPRMRHRSPHITNRTLLINPPENSVSEPNVAFDVAPSGAINENFTN